MLAGNLSYMGADVGASSALFSAVLSYLAGQWIGLCHGALICQSEGLRVDECGKLLNGLSTVLGAELEHMGEVIQQNRFGNPESTVKTTGMDLVKLVQHANEAKINSSVHLFAGFSYCT
jgi:hypothetical protein